MKIFIDPGHGGNSVGAVLGERYEKDDVLRLSLLIKEILSSQDNVEVMLSREDDNSLEISERVKMAEDFGADYFLSVHRNAAGRNIASGAEIWCYSKIAVGGETYLKAKNILSELCKASGFLSRGVKLGAPSYEDFGVNRLTTMNSALLEVGFIDSDTDNKIFDEKLKESAKGIAVGLMAAVGLNFKEKEIPGDVNGDGKITSSDARSILRASVGLEEVPLQRGDMDGDGKITSSDARTALRKATGLE